MSRIPHRFGGLSLMAIALAAAVAPPAQAAPSYEQVGRTDGPTGVAPLEGAWVHGAAITDDGRTAFVSFDTYAQTWVSAAGIWRRDLDTNRSSQIVGGTDATITGLTADNTLLSFVTVKRLNSADTNGLPDLYAYNLSTKAITLVSRADGATGAATGLDAADNGFGGSGYITRHGKAALFATPTDVMRRDLATGRTTVITANSYTDPFGRHRTSLGPNFGSALIGDRTASADGRVYISGSSLITPTGRVALQVGYPGSTAAVSADGAVAAYTRVDQATETLDKSSLMVVNATTNTERRIELSAVAPDGYTLAGFTADHAKALIWKVQPDGSGALKSVNLTSLAVADLGLPNVIGVGSPSTAPTLSNTLRFAVAGNGWATSANGFALPGGVDLPSAAAYVSLNVGCKGAGWPFNGPSTLPTLSLNFASYGTAVRSFAVTIKNSVGSVLQTLSASAPVGQVELKTGGNAYTVQIATIYVDGRTTNETWSQPTAPGCMTPL